MSTLTELIEKFDPARIRPALEKSVDDTKDAYVAYQRDQLEFGENKKGERIRRLGEFYYPYAPFTVSEKLNKTGLAGVIDRVTLFDEGNFYAGIFLKRNGLDIILSSSDWKLEKLEGDYGQILGLGGVYRAEYVKKYYRPAFKKNLNLRF